MPNLNELWSKACEYIREEILSPVTYKTWIESIVPLKIDEDMLYISVPTEINKRMIEQRYLELIRNSVLEVTGRKYTIVVVLDSEKDNYVEQTKNPEKKDNGNTKYTFDNFIVGNSNRFAHAASLAVAESPGTAYNPIFIWGGVGLGKTHLMHAIENYINENQPKLKTLFVPAETFMVELINSMGKNTEDFRQKYRYVDALFVDDIHFIAGKVATEEEFFNTFNSLFEAGKQIILSSDRPPQEIPNLAERLSSRFSWGILCDIQPPDYETRVAILKQKAKDQNIEIDTEILMYIADNITMNIRELEGVFRTLSAYSGFVNTKITMEMAEDAIKKYHSIIAEKVITPTMIIDAVAKLYRIKEDEITSQRRTKELVVPRHISIYLCKNLTELSYNKIGEYFGGRDHTTIIHAIRKVESDLKTDERLKNDIDKLTQDLKRS
ncbi:MAG: chromosomal replication initiator protein DnaA [Bacillota bacterium]|nr:chromosomal replication initiator protein DnaA [Bacillota bacterium]